MDEFTAFERASQGFLERARLITPEQWSASTPCSEWDVRAVVNHVAGEYLWVPEMLAGKRVADVGSRLDGDLLGNDPLQTVVAAHSAALAACEDDAARNATVHLSFGDSPARDYAKQMAIDSVIHSWDLARAIGADETLDPELVDFAYAELEQSAEAWREGGAFGPKVATTDDSAQARLLALTGR